MWTYFDIFEKVFKPNNFIISKGKYLFMGGRPMPECSMVNCLFDIVVESFGSYLLGIMFCINLILLATEIVHIYPAVTGRVYHRAYVSRLFTFFVVWICWVGYLAFLSSFIVLGLSYFLELF